MKNKIAIVVVCFFPFSLFAQKSPMAVGVPVVVDTVSEINTNKTAPLVDETHIENPNLGLGVGVLSYYGDINTKISKSPLNGRISSELTVSQRLTECFLLNFNFLFGKVGANERNAPGNRNSNFESEIRAGSVSLVYDFGNYLPLGRNATPFISIGISGFEFLSKTDLKDKNGNTYFYWTDGTVRNIDQKAPNAGDAVLLKRDYTYESDVRNLTLQNFGKYPQRSFAIPFGIGFSFRINNFVTFRISTTMYRTFTDKLDGIVQNNSSRIIARFKNDNYRMSSCGIIYNFQYKPKVLHPEIEGFSNANVDFNRIDLSDSDKDGVPDIKDYCQHTPAGEAVDTAGCPLDDDKDYIPNYKDKELKSPEGAIIDPKGVQLTDAKISESYERYRDTTMKYASVQDLEVFKTAIEDKYVISLGIYEKADFAKLPQQIVADTLLTEIKITETKSNYIVGLYNYLDEAEKRKTQLVGEGLDSAKVMVKQNGNYFYVEPTKLSIPKIEKTEKNENQLLETTPLNNNNEETKTSTPTTNQSPINAGGEKLKEFVGKIKNLFKPKPKVE